MSQHSKLSRFKWGWIVLGLILGIRAVAIYDKAFSVRLETMKTVSAEDAGEDSAVLVPSAALAATDKRAAATQARKIEALQGKMARLAPKGIYALVDTAQNRLWLKKGDKILYEARVSTGSRTTLIKPGDSPRKWVFETPRGAFKIQSKIKNPLWVKPDWAFVEEGKALPVALNERMEAGVLGDYALGFGKGYFIHGTLYTRMLGKNVTHGCIRMADSDLEFVYKNLPVGAPLYIF